MPKNSITQARARVKLAYDPALFSEAAQNIVNQLTVHLDALQRPPFETMDWTSPESMLKLARFYLDQTERAPLAGRIRELTGVYLQRVNGLHSPHYIGHQVPAPVPIAAAFELIGSCLNQPSGIYEMGPFSAASEKALIQKIGEAVGWDTRTFDGIGTHGGSLANLTAVLAARNFYFKHSWKDGLGDENLKPAILASSDAHYSISRSAGILGVGANRIISAPLDSKRRIDPDKTYQLLSQARAQGTAVFCIIGSACTTPIGAFDPLKELAKLASENGIWFHIDAAHGGPLLFSKRYKHLLEGIELADSITWDAHKMMFVPALCTFLLYRDKTKSYLPFQQDAPYLFDPGSEGTIEFDSALRTVECTKRPLAMALWAVWSTFGPSLFEDLVDVTCHAAREFYDLIKETRDFIPAHDPQCNILCFRYLPEFTRGADESRISQFHVDLRKSVVQTGKFYITGTKLDGKNTLRVSVMNPLTEKLHFESLLAHIREIGNEIWEETKNKCN
ncbi:MAG: pyridoxal-dependent decarboxylase [Bdellovibrionota bacterium]